MLSTRHKLNDVPVGEYTASVLWVESGIGERFRENIPIKVTEKQVVLFLDADGQDVVQLDRMRNKSARVYPGLTVRQVAEERVRNFVRNSTSCCFEGEREPLRTPVKCPHTPEWYRTEITQATQRLRRSK